MAEEYGVEYVEVLPGALENKVQFMSDYIKKDMHNMYEPIVNFVRD